MATAERPQEVGRRKGRQEGRQGGQHAEALRIVQRILDNDIVRETIVKITDPATDEIVALEH